MTETAKEPAALRFRARRSRRWRREARNSGVVGSVTERVITPTRMTALVVATTAVGLMLGLPASGPAATSRCAARASTTLLENSQVRVFRQPTHASRRKFEVFACSKASGQGTPLGAVGGGDYPFLPPAIDLSGPVVGSAVEQCDSDFCATSIAATDMREPHPSQGNLNGSYAAPRPHHLVKVGSLAVARNGTLIWIACPERSRAKVRGSREPNCVRAGDRDTVWLRRPKGSPFKRLDMGRTIDPSSLRLKDGRISWVHGHRRRHAGLPGG